MTQTCQICELTQDELDADGIEDIVVGPAGEGRGSYCTICRSDGLRERTVLSKREAEVAAHKQISGASHATIADRLGLDKSTVDEYSRRFKDKIRKSRATVNELSEFL